MEIALEIGVGEKSGYLDDVNFIVVAIDFHFILFVLLGFRRTKGSSSKFKHFQKSWAIREVRNF